MGFGVRQAMLEELPLPIEKQRLLRLGFSPELLEELDPLADRKPPELVFQGGSRHREERFYHSAGGHKTDAHRGRARGSREPAAFA